MPCRSVHSSFSWLSYSASLSCAPAPPTSVLSIMTSCYHYFRVLQYQHTLQGLQHAPSCWLLGSRALFCHLPLPVASVDHFLIFEPDRKLCMSRSQAILTTSSEHTIRVKDVTQQLPRLVRTSDYYPLLVLHVGSEEAAKGSLKAIKRDIKALGQLVEGSGAQAVFSSILSVAGKNREWNSQTQLINTWL